MRQKVTAIVPTFNNEKTITRCLNCLTWADEILVVDSFSTDRTVQICRNYTDRVLQHEYVNSATQKNWAIPQARHDWILQVDTDEVLEEGFREEVGTVFEDSPPGIDGFRVPRKNLIFGKWVKTCGYYPDYAVRLFKKTCRYQNRKVHAHIDLSPERTEFFQHHIIHHDLEDFQSYLLKFARYMNYEVEQLIEEGRKFRIREITLRPVYMFCWSYFYKQGFRDGIRGFLLSVCKAYYNFSMYIRLWEKT